MPIEAAGPSGSDSSGAGAWLDFGNRKREFQHGINPNCPCPARLKDGSSTRLLLTLSLCNLASTKSIRANHCFKGDTKHASSCREEAMLLPHSPIEWLPSGLQARHGPCCDCCVCFWKWCRAWDMPMQRYMRRMLPKSESSKQLHPFG